jgi:hypothetical protein
LLAKYIRESLTVTAATSTRKEFSSTSARQDKREEKVEVEKGIRVGK